MNDLGLTNNGFEPGKNPAPPELAPPSISPIKETASTEAENGNSERSDDRLSSSEKPPALNSPRTSESDAAQTSTATRPSIAELEETVTKINDFVQSIQRELRFSIDDESGDTVVKVIEKATNEVVRQIPAEDLMESLKNLNQNANSGVIISKQA